MADLCEKVGANVQDVARGMGLDNRIGSKFLHPGPGFGGSCFPKDTLALIKHRRGHGVRARASSTRSSEGNERRKRAMAGRVIEALGGSVAGKTSRSSASPSSRTPTTCARRRRSSIIPDAAGGGRTVRAFDPKGMDQARPLLPGAVFAADPYECATGADALVLVTEWESFRALDLDRLRARMKQPVLVDLRNIYPPAEIRAHGFTYRSIGRSMLDGEGLAEKVTA